MRLTLDGRVALVSGAAQGIGRATAALLRQAGATVALTDVDPAGLTRSAAELGLTDNAAVCDLSDRKATGHLVARLTERHARLDIVINAAGGVCGQTGRPLEEIAESDWRAVFAANVDSAFWLAQAAAPVMKKHGFGRIVHIASGAGLRPSLTGIQAYTAAKHALVGLTKQLSFELGPHGITVNAVAPGLVLSNPTTERQWQAYGAQGQAQIIASVHRRRLGQAEDVAQAVLFFASEAADWVSGQVLSVDGGRS